MHGPIEANAMSCPTLVRYLLAARGPPMLRPESADAQPGGMDPAGLDPSIENSG
jgi:hypothetical protein